MTHLQNKVAVITGGSDGIGKGIAERFLEEGAKVVIFARDQSKLDKAAEELKKISDTIYAVQGDVCNTADLKKLFAETKKQFGKIDVLVANAGASGRIPIQDVTEEFFDTIMNTTYRGTFFTVKYALDYLNDGASIILNGSIACYITMKRNPVYSSAKYALLKLAQNLACDLSDRLIRVNTISPGYTKTSRFDARLAIDPNYFQPKVENTPLKRIGTPRDIANAALFLASEESSFITGIDMLVDGGYAANYPTE